MTTREPNCVRRRSEAYVAQAAKEEDADGGGLLALGLAACGGLGVRRRRRRDLGEEEIGALLERLEEEASEEGAEVVDDLVDALVVHGDGAEGQEVLLALRQQLLEEGLLEEEEDEAHRVGGHGLEHGSEGVERVGGERVGVGSVHELTKLPKVSGNERKGGGNKAG